MNFKNNFKQTKNNIVLTASVAGGGTFMWDDIARVRNLGIQYTKL